MVCIYYVLPLCNVTTKFERKIDRKIKSKISRVYQEKRGLKIMKYERCMHQVLQIKPKFNKLYQCSVPVTIPSSNRLGDIFINQHHHNDMTIEHGN